MRREQSVTPGEFWAQIEKVHGEKVLGYALAQNLEGFPEFPAPCWGVVFVTESSVCFHTFPQNNWLSSLLGGVRRSGGSGAPNEEAEQCLAVGAIRSATMEPRPSVWRRILTPSFPTLRIETTDRSGGELSIRLEMENNGERIAEIIRAALRDRD